MLLRSNIGLLSALRARPRMVSRAGFIAPTCALCDAPLSGEELVEAPSGKTFVRVLGKHHGAEQLVTFELGTSEHTPEDLHRAMRGFAWFAPNVEKGAVNDE